MKGLGDKPGTLLDLALTHTGDPTTVFWVWKGKATGEKARRGRKAMTNQAVAGSMAAAGRSGLGGADKGVCLSYLHEGPRTNRF